MSKFYISIPRQGTSISTGEGFNTKDVVAKGVLDGDWIKVIAPQDTAKKWPVVKAGYFVECNGPARPLDHIEYSQLVHRMCFDNAN